MANRMVPMSVIFNGLGVIWRLQAFLNAICGTFVQNFTRFQLTACSCSSVLAEFLVLKAMDNFTAVMHV